ncbi:MAG: viroplasmin family protein [Erysipelotrichaceae bacterium]|nr:viroplasmin family protein [Erysipelotrichaceae bacterium]MBR0473416.1 viroplasmin family protein [Erysipelotrichaceae bacterium]
MAENPLIFSRWDECQQAITGNIKKACYMRFY